MAKRKVAKPEEPYDPLDIYKSKFAEFLRETAKRGFFAKPLKEPPYPLLADKKVRRIMAHIKREDKKLMRSYDIHRQNPYLHFNEGTMLRTEVIVALVMRYMERRP